jgi:hypothetical protein
MRVTIASDGSVGAVTLSRVREGVVGGSAIPRNRGSTVGCYGNQAG